MQAIGEHARLLTDLCSGDGAAEDENASDAAGDTATSRFASDCCCLDADSSACCSDSCCSRDAVASALASSSACSADMACCEASAWSFRRPWSAAASSCAVEACCCSSCTRRFRRCTAASFPDASGTSAALLPTLEAGWGAREVEGDRAADGRPPEAVGPASRPEPSPLDVWPALAEQVLFIID